MCQDVVGDEQVGDEAVGDQVLPRLVTQEDLSDLEAQVACSSSCARRRLDSRAFHPTHMEEVEERPVIGRHLYHSAGPIQTEPLGRFVSVGPAVLQPGGRETAEVGVVGIEQVGGIGEVLGLDKPARLADQHTQREPGLGGP